MYSVERQRRCVLNACLNGKLYFLDKAYKEGLIRKDVICGREHGDTKSFMWYASASGNLDIVRWLYKMGCPTTAKNTTDGTTTSLHIACYNNHIDIARFLFKNGAANDRFVFDEAGLLPIHVACVGGHRDIVLWLGRDVDGRSEQKSANGLDVRSKSGLTLMDICSACDHKELAEALRFFGCTHVSSLPPLHGRLEPDDEDRLLEKKYIGKLASLNRPKN